MALKEIVRFLFFCIIFKYNILACYHFRYLLSSVEAQQSFVCFEKWIESNYLNNVQGTD